MMLDTCRKVHFQLRTTQWVASANSTSRETLCATWCFPWVAGYVFLNLLGRVSPCPHVVWKTRFDVLRNVNNVEVPHENIPIFPGIIKPSVVIANVGDAVFGEAIGGISV